MAWERSFEKRVHKIREKELRYQKLNYNIEVNSFVYAYGKALLMHVAGPLECYIQLVSYPRHVDRVLALYCCPRTGVDSFNCIYFGEFFYSAQQTIAKFITAQRYGSYSPFWIEADRY